MEQFSSTSSLVLTATSFALLGLYFYYNNTFSYWKRRGIGGPKPIPFVGNLHHVFVKNRGYYEISWRQKYGKVFGIYHGSKPRLVIADPELLNEICVKNFNSFLNHGVPDFMSDIIKSFLFGAKDDNWKRMRTLMSPTFTSGKMKRMYKFMDFCSDDLIDCIREQSQAIEGQPIELSIGEIYNLYALQTIFNCCYSIKIKRFGSQNLNEIAEKDAFLRSIINTMAFKPFKFILFSCLPQKIISLLNLELMPECVMEPSIKKLTGLMQQRKQNPNKFDDYLQMLVHVQANGLQEGLHQNELTSEANSIDMDHYASLNTESFKDAQRDLLEQVKSASHSSNSSIKSSVTLDDIEILACAIFLASVGVHTTGTALTTVTYLLAYHAEIQENLRSELRKICAPKSDTTGQFTIDHDSLMQCKYLDAVVSEALRLFSPAIQTDRICSQDYYLSKYNLHIPKGQGLIFALHAMHNDPELWPNPSQFDPNRFMPGNKEKIKPNSYAPFGIGPRHCIGMRFSLTEIKLALAKVLLNFKLVPASNTEYPPRLEFMGFMHKIADPRVKLLPIEL